MYKKYINFFKQFILQWNKREDLQYANCAARGTPLKIIKLLKYPRQTVYDVCKRFDEIGKEQRSAHNSRRDRILKPTFLAGLKRSIKANPAVPMTELEKKRSISVMTIKRVSFLSKK